MIPTIEIVAESFMPPDDAVPCLGCLKSPGNRTDCNHKDCTDLDGCLSDDCPHCEGNAWVIP